MSLTRHLVRSPLDKKLMIPLAYINVRPFLFVGGRPLFVGIVLLASCLIGPQWQKGPVSLISALIFTGLFTLFLIGFGPFAGKEEIREYEMVWSIEPSSSDGMKESQVVLSFEEFPHYAVGEYSDELAACPSFDVLQQGKLR